MEDINPNSDTDVTKRLSYVSAVHFATMFSLAPSATLQSSSLILPSGKESDKFFPCVWLVHVAAGSDYVKLTHFSGPYVGWSPELFKTAEDFYEFADFNLCDFIPGYLGFNALE